MEAKKIEPELAYISTLVADLRAKFDRGITRPYKWRMQQLGNLARMLKEREDQICAALKQDLGKPRLESFSTEVAYCASENDLTMKKLKSWMKPESVRTTMLAMPGKSRIYRDPLGVVLIIAPWNYPFGLSIAPLIGAIAAGNAVVLKPSEISSATSALIADLLPKYLDSDCVKVVEGAVDEATALLAERFDHIFYTGNGTVGRIVMAAAAKNLTPVTLELGGKSPAIIDRDANLDVAVKRICWGKFTNAGQTCVAPDYLLVHEDVYDQVLTKLRQTIVEFYGNDPQQSADYGRIINVRHHKRLMALIDSGRVVIGGTGDETTRYIAPTVLADVAENSPVMTDEIFGPILPVLRVASLNDAITLINDRPKPLALYMFTASDRNAEDVLRRTSSGGASINHAWLHLSVPGLPFGGVGESGMGAYHGRHSFETFSHRKAVLKKPTFIDPSVLYPPYGDFKSKVIKTLL